MRVLIKRLTPARIITLGFILLILTGSILLSLPVSVREGVELPYIDALYTATSAVCVTGLIAADAGDTFTPIGQFFLAMLIQFGGLGVTTVGAGVMIAIGKKINLKGRTLIREALNVQSGKGLVLLIRKVIMVTVLFETAGAALSFLTFSRDYPIPQAIGISCFHSVAAFNNSGFDILGNYQNMIPYQGDVLLNLVTGGLIFFGGIGFLVIWEIWQTGFRWKKFSMHTKVVLTVSILLIAVGAVLLKATENITWLSAFFHSVSARTAGFSSCDLGAFSNAGLLTLIALMFIGASPGSTGGGIKTSTFFVLLQGIKSSSTNCSEKAFRYAIPKDAFRKAAVIFLLAIGMVITGTYLMAIFEPQLSLIDILFEITSAFGTVGLSTGITRTLGVDSKLLSILIMLMGRLGPLTIATLWHFGKGDRIRYPEGNIMIG